MENGTAGCRRKICAARETFLQAKIEAEQLGARWILWQILAALGEWKPAGEMIAYIAQNTPAEPEPGAKTNLRAAFLNLPAVREILAR